MEISRKFWRGKKVFVTGHTGFKGAWLSALLLSMGSTVKGFALAPPTDPSLFAALDLDADMQSVSGDIRNLDLLKSHLDTFEPDIVIHMAAQAIVRESYQNPVDTFQVNAMGTAHVLEAVRYLNNAKAVICVTSDKCYENREWPWKYRENDSMGGWDPYSASKGCSELVVASYRNSFFNKERYNHHGVAIASVRAGNVIGGGDWGQDRLIPDIMKAFSQNESVIIRNPFAIRPWQFVLDLLSGYLLLAQRLFEDGSNYMEAWNFGPNDSDERSVRDIVQLAVDLWGNGACWKSDANAAANPHEAFTLKLDSGKSRSRLGWMPKLDIENSLAYVVDWYKHYYSNSTSMKHYTEQQIGCFEKHLQLSSSSSFNISGRYTDDSICQ